MTNFMSFSGGGVVQLVKNGLKSVGGRVRAFGRVSERAGSSARIERMEGRELMAAVPAWVNTFGDEGGVGNIYSNRINGVVTDGDNNVYVAGDFIGTVDFDFGAGERILTATRASGFIAKYSSGGELSWIAQMEVGENSSAEGRTSAQALSMDSSGNLYAAGWFRDSLEVDFVSGGASLKSSGGSDIFVAKVSLEGKLGLIKQFYGSGNEGVYGFVGSQEGGITIMGRSLGGINLDVTGQEVMLEASENESVDFVSTYDGSMNLVSYVAIHGTGDFGGASLSWADFVPGSKTLILAANVVATSEMFSSGGQLAAITTSSWGAETFVASIDMAGAPAMNWSKSITSSYSVGTSAATVDKNGNVYLGINFSGVADLNPGEAVAKADAGAGSQMAIVSLDAAGAYRWSAVTGPNGTGSISEMIVRPDSSDSSKSVVVSVGNFTNKVQFDPAGSAAGVRTSVSPAGFAWSLRADGTFVDAAGIYGNPNGVGTSETGQVQVTCVAGVNGADSLVLGGTFTGRVDFDASTGTKMVDSTSIGETLDLFFGRFAQAGTADQINESVPYAPGIKVTGLGVVINNKDTTPNGVDGTDLGVYFLGKGQISVTFTVTNTGVSVLEVSDLRVPAGFELVDGLEYSIKAGQSDTFTLTFAPWVEGTFGGDVSFTTNVAGMESFGFAVAGTSEEYVDPSVPRSGIDVKFGGKSLADGLTNPSVGSGTWFGEVKEGAAEPSRTFTITNDGKAPLELGQIRLPDGFYLMENVSGTLAVGESVSFTVVLSTYAGGYDLAGDVVIATNAPGENPFNFAIGGRVVAPLGMAVKTDTSEQVLNGMGMYDVSGTNFGYSSYVGSTGVRHSFVVSNTGSEVLRISGFKAPAGLKVLDPLAGSIAPGKSDTFTLVIDTSAVREVTGNVSFKTNVPWDQTFTFEVSGSVSARKAAGGAFEVDGRSSLLDRTFFDELGNKVVFAVTGPGEILVEQRDDGALLQVTSTGTDIRTALMVTVTKDAKVEESTGVTSIGAIDISGGLASFTGSRVNILERFAANGAVKALTLNDLSGEIRVGGASTEKVAMVFGKMVDVHVSTTATLTSLKATEWLGVGGMGLEAARLGSVTIAGDFEADIVMSGLETGATAPVVSVSVGGSAMGRWLMGINKVNVAIKGHVNWSNWVSNAGFGSITVGGYVDSLTLETGGDLASFKAGPVRGTSLKVEGAVGSVSVTDWLGAIYAGKVGTIVTAGRAPTPTIMGNAGDFSGPLTVVGMSTSAGSKSVGSITVKGSVIGSDVAGELDWDITGGVGAVTIGANVVDFVMVTQTKGGSQGNVASFSVGGVIYDSSLKVMGKLGAMTVDSVGGASVQATGDIASFTSKGQTQGMMLETLGAIGAVTSANWMEGVIHADKVASITIRGRAATRAVPEAIEGDFTGEVTLTGEGVATTALTLGAVNIQGGLMGGEWNVGGKAGAFTVGSASQVGVRVAGDLTSFTSKGTLSDMHLWSYSAMGAVKGVSFDHVELAAVKLASLTATGLAATKTTEAVAGDFVGKVLVTGVGVGPKALALGSVSIAGMVRESALGIGGNAGAVTVGGMVHSAFFVGVKLDRDAGVLPMVKSDFMVLDGKTGALATLAGFTVTGKAVGVNEASFVNSRVAAGTFTNVSLKRVDLEGTEVNGFAAGAKIGAYSRLTGLSKPGDVVKVANKVATGIYDPAGGSGDEGYLLRIVVGG